MNNNTPRPVEELIKEEFEFTPQNKIVQKITTGDKEQEKETKSVALQLVDEIRKENILFFHNEQKEGFAAIKGDGREIYKLRSRTFRQYIAHCLYKQIDKVISSDVINNIVQVLEGKAIFEGKRHELAVRMATQDNAIWYDLGNGSAVHIDKDGWTISEMPPILFRRYVHQSLQVEPRHGSDLKKLCNFINLKHDEDKLLFLVYTVAAFIPGFPHPILVFYGAQGSGKTTPQRILKSLIDPSLLKTLSAPDNVREFVQLVSHHYFVFFDNISSLKQWLSDSLARAVTGDGFSKRELYSDDDDIIYSFQRTIALNGINLVVQRADLLERSILISLERISKKERREEQEFWEEFNKQKPYLLGSIFTIVAGALRERPDIQLTSRPRMADFARWGCAIAKALGYAQEEFLTAYSNNIAKQNTEAIEASPVATTIVALMSTQDAWEGTATDLYKELESHAQSLRIDTKSHEWPKDPSALSRKLNVTQTNLAEEGILITKNETVRPKRLLIKKVQENPDDADNEAETNINEAKEIMPALEDTTVNPDTNPDNKVQSQNDGMTGLSALTDNSENEIPIKLGITNDKITNPVYPNENAVPSRKPCYCGSKRFWKTKSGNIVCETCHPPALEADVVERLAVEEKL